MKEKLHATEINLKDRFVFDGWIHENILNKEKFKEIKKNNQSIGIYLKKPNNKEYKQVLIIES